MEPEPGNPHEIEGVLNPAAARGPDGELYLFPRMVAKGNYSRIGIVRVRFNGIGDPAGVEPLKRYFMTYTAFSAHGPRIALAVSEDLFHWKRLGLAIFASSDGIDFDN